MYRPTAAGRWTAVYTRSGANNNYYRRTRRHCRRWTVVMEIIIIIGARRPSRLCARPVCVCVYTLSVSQCVCARVYVCMSSRAREKSGRRRPVGTQVERSYTHINTRALVHTGWWGAELAVGRRRAHAIFTITSPGPPWGYIFYPPADRQSPPRWP